MDHMDAPHAEGAAPPSARGPMGGDRCTISRTHFLVFLFTCGRASGSRKDVIFGGSAVGIPAGVLTAICSWGDQVSWNIYIYISSCTRPTNPPGTTNTTKNECLRGGASLAAALGDGNVHLDRAKPLSELHRGGLVTGWGRLGLTQKNEIL